MVARERGYPSGQHIGGSSPTQSTFLIQRLGSSLGRPSELGWSPLTQRISPGISKRNQGVTRRIGAPFVAASDLLPFPSDERVAP